MSEKNPKGYDELIEVFSQGVSDLTSIIIDSAKPMKEIVNNLKKQLDAIVVPVITENMENIIININKGNSKGEEIEE